MIVCILRQCLGIAITSGPLVSKVWRHAAPPDIFPARAATASPCAPGAQTLRRTAQETAYCRNRKLGHGRSRRKSAADFCGSTSQGAVKILMVGEFIPNTQKNNPKTEMIKLDHNAMKIATSDGPFFPSHLVQNTSAASGTSGASSQRLSKWTTAQMNKC